MASAAAPHDDFDRARMLAEVAEGLRAPQKRLSPKYFYDARGSELFEAITRLPEYYLTRTERALLRAHAPGLVARLGPRSLVELGAGSAAKTRLLLDAMVADGRGVTYVPVDVSRAFLMEVARELTGEYPDLRVEPAVADMTQELRIDGAVPRPALFAILGSTIGNFLPPAAEALLRRVRALMEEGDALLLGVDLHKDTATLEAAYDDAGGVTAEFNRNVLRVLNTQLGADFDPDAFEHRALYNVPERRVEMHLVARAPQRVRIPGIGTLDFEQGESIHTESSCKHERASVEALLSAADLSVTRWTTDDEGRFALVVATAR
ncbi:MAG TPA: L-histidine N(alpha)-methyltransferase [Longimicrobiales bacterium]|nr:L-histidine N(alpha)-methyltransferase [Longimicrobiales bacterium]